jgi:hypothetical protein
VQTLVQIVTLRPDCSQALFLIDGIHAWTERLGRGFPHVWSGHKPPLGKSSFRGCAPTIGAEVHLPFGGVKHTGNGHREGNGALDFFTAWKAVYVDYSDNLQRAQIDNAMEKPPS